MAVLNVEKVKKVIPYLFGIVKQDLVLGNLITRVPSETFTGSLNDTVTMKVPGLYTNARAYDFRTRTAPIILDDIQGGGAIDIKLDQHLYSATGLTDEHMKLDEIDLLNQVLKPQGEAIANLIEQRIVTGFNGMGYKWTIPFKGGDDPFLIAAEAQRLWGQPEAMYVPDSGRVWVTGSNVYAAIVTHPHFTEANRGTQAIVGSALADATVGRVGGYPVVYSKIVDPNFSVIMDKSAMVFGNVAPLPPRGASFSQAHSQSGFAMRWLMDYDANYLQDRSIVSTFAGLSYVYDERKGGTGTDRYELKTYASGETPATVRAIKINFTPAKAGGSVLPGA